MATRISVFEISGCRYGIPLADTREFLRLPRIVPLPKAPLIVEGIVNIRGTMVPVLDIRKRFRLPEKLPHPADHLVVAQAGFRLVALRVDRVLGIDDIDPKDIDKAETITPCSEYVAGVAKLPDGLVLIHDIRTFLADSEARGLDEALDSSAEALP